MIWHGRADPFVDGGWIAGSGDEVDVVWPTTESPYGLSGAVFTSVVERGNAVASRIRTGRVEVNGSPIGLSASFGGFNDSGIGRENGREGLAPYMALRSIGVPPGTELEI